MLRRLGAVTGKVKEMCKITSAPSSTAALVEEGLSGRACCWAAPYWEASCWRGGHKGESYGVGHEGDRPEKDKKVLQSLL